jgi:hypothetical protein
MIAISGGWLDPEKGSRKDIESIPAAAALLPLIQAAHDGVLQTQAQDDSPSPALVENRRSALDKDRIHDRKGRGLFLVLSGFAELIDDEALSAACLALRDKIFPPAMGLRILGASYVDEAGEVELVEQRVTAEDRAQLKKLPYPEGKLLDAHNARVEAGRDLGNLERERTTLEAEAEDAESAIAPADVLIARNTWIKGARALAIVIGFAAPSDAVRLKILKPLDDAERKADDRASATATDPAQADPAADPAADKGAPPAADNTGPAPVAGAIHARSAKVQGKVPATKAKAKRAPTRSAAHSVAKAAKRRAR